MQVTIKISDPWERGETRKWQPIKGEIQKKKVESICEALLIKLMDPFEYNNDYCEFFIASPRHVGTSFDDVFDGQSVFSCLTHVPSDRIDYKNPFDLSWWRGGLVIIGNIEISDDDESITT